MKFLKIKISLYYFASILMFCTFNLSAQNINYSQLQITELHFHPIDSIKIDGDTIKSKNFEFVEFKNTSDKSINLFGCSLKGGVRYTFKEDDLIEPNEFFVLAEDKKMFKKRYGFKADGRFKGKLSNKGETIYLLDPNNNIIDKVEYYDNYSWTKGADGEGKSLALIPSADNNLAFSWATLKEGSTPKADNLNFSQAYKLTFLKVTNVMGKTMIELQEDEIFEQDFKQISENWPTGVYILEIIQNDELRKDSFVKQ